MNKTPEEVRAIVEELKVLYPEGICSLEYKKDYELLFSVRLAAQCTDERVNKVTPALYARFPTLEALAEADISEVEEYIHSTGFFRAKAKDIVLASQMLLRDYGGKVPDGQSHPGGRVPHPRRGGGRHPLHPHHRPAGPHRRYQGPRQSGDPAAGGPAPGGVQRLLPPDGPPRPGGVHRPETPVRGLHPAALVRPLR